MQMKTRKEFVETTLREYNGLDWKRDLECSKTERIDFCVRLPKGLFIFIMINDSDSDFTSPQFELMRNVSERQHGYFEAIVWICVFETDERFISRFEATD